LADYAADPREFAIDTRGDQLARALAPLASDTVTTIVGFTEVTGTGRLYNTAAILHKGAVLGLYRKLYPAINRSVYDAGDQMPVFRVGGLIFGIVICNDSNYPEPAKIMASKGVAAHARSVDIALARENNICVIRADVAGRTNGMVSYGSSGIVDPHGNVLQSAQRLTEELIVADLEVPTPEPSCGNHRRDPRLAVAHQSRP